jgi:hypothetical protein
VARQIRTAEDKTRPSDCQGCDGHLNYGEESVSVALEEVKSQDWAEKVYKPDIKEKWDKLYKKPGYTM